MITNWHPASDFTQQLLDYLTKVEGNHWYAQDVGDGKVTIGSGFNISETKVREFVYTKFGITAKEKLSSLATADAITAETAYRAELDNAITSHNIAALDGIMLRRALDPRLAILDGTGFNVPARRTDFKFHSDMEVKETLTDLLPVYDQRLTNWLTALGADASFQTSLEHIVLLSLSFNSKTGKSDLLGDGLRNAINSGNRAEAWYEIRYNSNKLGWAAIKGTATAAQLVEIAKGIDGGLANRRYKESDLFGLYGDPTQLTDAQKLNEAKDVYRMFTQHRQDIFRYEDNYLATNVNAGSTTIRDQLALACVTLMGDLAGNVNPDIALAWQKWVDAGNDPLNFDTTKLFYDTGRGIAIDARQYTVPGVMGVEVASNDIVIGESVDARGGDIVACILTGGKAANDPMPLAA